MENYKNGLYDYTIVALAYNTNRIEGSTLTFSDTQSLYEHNIINSGGHSMDDLIESKNHFKLFDFMLKTNDEPLIERLIKEYHHILKQGTSDEVRYGIGRYKQMPNIAGEQQVVDVHEVAELMEELIRDCNTIANINDILSFHHRFELIHPFQDGNGRVGRTIMFRQCLTQDIIPFILFSDRKDEYIDGLKYFITDPSLLEKEVQIKQEEYKQIATPFIKHYKNG